MSENVSGLPRSSGGKQGIESLAYEVLFLFSFSLTELNVTLSSLTPDDDVGVKLYSWRQRWGRIGFHGCCYSKIREGKGERRNNGVRSECQSTEASAVLRGANPTCDE